MNRMGTYQLPKTNAEKRVSYALNWCAEVVKNEELQRVAPLRPTYISQLSPFTKRGGKSSHSLVACNTYPPSPVTFTKEDDEMFLAAVSWILLPLYSLITLEATSLDITGTTYRIVVEFDVCVRYMLPGDFHGVFKLCIEEHIQLNTGYENTIAHANGNCAFPLNIASVARRHLNFSTSESVPSALAVIVEHLPHEIDTEKQNMIIMKVGRWTAAREKMWENLPAMFKLSNWQDLSFREDVEENYRSFGKSGSVMIRSEELSTCILFWKSLTRISCLFEEESHKRNVRISRSSRHPCISEDIRSELEQKKDIPFQKSACVSVGNCPNLDTAQPVLVQVYLDPSSVSGEDILFSQLRKTAVQKQSRVGEEYFWQRVAIKPVASDQVKPSTSHVMQARDICRCMLPETLLRNQSGGQPHELSRRWRYCALRSQFRMASCIYNEPSAKGALSRHFLFSPPDTYSPQELSPTDMVCLGDGVLQLNSSFFGWGASWKVEWNLYALQFCSNALQNDVEQGATGNGDCHAPLLLSTAEGLSLIPVRRVPISCLIIIIAPLMGQKVKRGTLRNRK
ncbi:hypothetical protein EV421DRAFT_1731386 [Armillaria borealis]|uniref:Uncharacterized protein n=1 Tax=Armillaria borealis TaxID=47425 RepID=A0AA39MZ84_9AGAR|nr:hypothetical protein EV421DRAFT_1731386 [Armillaria borealis]